jgi:hypothetical protein
MVLRVCVCVCACADVRLFVELGVGVLPLSPAWQWGNNGAMLNDAMGTHITHRNAILADGFPDRSESRIWLLKDAACFERCSIWLYLSCLYCVLCADCHCIRVGSLALFEDRSVFEPVLLEYKTTEANWLLSVVREGRWKALQASVTNV